MIKGLVNGKSAVINNKSEIIYIQTYDEEDISIMYDKKDNVSSLICIYRTGEEIKTKYYENGESYDNISTRYIYIDKTGKELKTDFDDCYFDLIYNNYAIDNNYDINNYGIAKIFDIENNKYIENEIKLKIIVCENNHLFGKELILEGNNKKYKYYLLDDDINIVKEISESEYEDLNGKDFENCQEVFDYHLEIGEKHNLKYILNEKRENLSK